jgi:tRNA-binding protein
MPEPTITWADFEKVELRIGTIIAVDEFPEAIKPAFKLTIDFGPEIGIKKSSAQVTSLYNQETIKGRQILAVTNFPPKRVGPFISEVLVTGLVLENGAVVLISPDRPVPNGCKLA